MILVIIYILVENGTDYQNLKRFKGIHLNFIKIKFFVF